MNADGLALALGHDTTCLRLAPHEALAADACVWRDSLVLIQEGVLDARCRSGESAAFGAGSVLCFDGLPPGSMSAGADGAVLLIKHRRTALS